MGSLGYNTILQLSLYCNREGKYKEGPYVQAFAALYQDSGEKGKYKLEDFEKCSSKILSARSETEDPLDLLLTSSASAERSWGKEGKTHPEVTSLDLEVRRLGPEIMGSEGKSLTITSAPPPYAPSPMGL